MAETLQLVRAKTDLDKLYHWKAEKLINPLAHFLVEHESKLLANTLRNVNAETPVTAPADTLKEKEAERDRHRQGTNRHNS